MLNIRNNNLCRISTDFYVVKLYAHNENWYYKGGKNPYITNLFLFKLYNTTQYTLNIYLPNFKVIRLSIEKVDFPVSPPTIN